ncbi:hypothetical protein [Mangrovibrevibacter kandeliae]|uniref:hypothetical protein n=1 Tax=Mangrovibrevibacter kandeliae TaxID=2968473 RepID=UPI0021194675|nr:hypothetical protein [Aurantimonas sp. CSK15Z-1]MCQ8781043.1 hypothetical protein [Aurantimonas sp. CSK15Z-1]
MRKKTFATRRLLSLTVLIVLSMTGSVWAEAVSWVRGASSDATMDRGQRFVCKGSGCPQGGLTCLYAVAPPRPPGSRRLDLKALLDPDIMDWPSVQGWAQAKLTMIRPELAADPILGGGRWTLSDDARAINAQGRAFVLKPFTFRASRAAFSVPVYLWAVDGRLHVALCVARYEAADAVQPVVAPLLAELNPAPPEASPTP